MPTPSGYLVCKPDKHHVHVELVVEWECRYGQ